MAVAIAVPPRRLAWLPVASSRGDVVEPVEPPSEGSSGIWTLRRGRLPGGRGMEFVRLGGPGGGVKVVVLEEREMVRLGGGGGGDLIVLVGGTGVAAVEEMEEVCAGSEREVSAAEVEEAQCWERMERDSSMGVKMERDLTDMRFTGSSIWAGGGACWVCGGGWCCWCGGGPGCCWCCWDGSCCCGCGGVLMGPEFWRSCCGKADGMDPRRCSSMYTC